MLGDLDLYVDIEVEVFWDVRLGTLELSLLDGVLLPLISLDFAAFLATFLADFFTAFLATFFAAFFAFFAIVFVGVIYDANISILCSHQAFFIGEIQFFLMHVLIKVT